MAKFAVRCVCKPSTKPAGFSPCCSPSRWSAPSFPYGYILSLVWLLLILYTFYFFRDPERAVPSDAGAVVAAADGVIVGIEEVEEPEVVKATMKRVAIFLSVFDVHTNRAPVAGKVTYTERRVGKMLDARHPDATRLNECRVWAIEHDHRTLVVRQITGAIARRIVAWAKVGQTVARRSRRFGHDPFRLAHGGLPARWKAEIDAARLRSTACRGGVSVIATAAHDRLKAWGGQNRGRPCVPA